MLANIASPVWGKEDICRTTRPTRLARRGIHYGWLMVALIFVFSMCGGRLDVDPRCPSDANIPRARMVDR